MDGPLLPGLKLKWLQNTDVYTSPNLIFELRFIPSFTVLAGRVVVAHLKLAQRVHQLRRRGGRVAPDQHLLTTKTTTAAESFSLSLVSQNEIIKIMNSHF